jgi:hypothetical protein
MWTKAPSRYREPKWVPFRGRGDRSKAIRKPSYLATEAEAFNTKTTTCNRKKRKK